MTSKRPDRAFHNGVHKNTQAAGVGLAVLGRIRKFDRFANQTEFRYGIHEYAGSANQVSDLRMGGAKV